MHQDGLLHHLPVLSSASFKVLLVTDGWHRDFGDKWDSTNFSYTSALGESCCVGNQEGIPTCLLREAARKSLIPWEAAAGDTVCKRREGQTEVLSGKCPAPHSPGWSPVCFQVAPALTESPLYLSIMPHQRAREAANSKSPRPLICCFFGIKLFFIARVLHKTLINCFWPNPSQAAACLPPHLCCLRTTCLPRLLCGHPVGQRGAGSAL